MSYATQDNAEELLGSVLKSLDTADLSDSEDNRIREAAVEAYKDVDEAESPDWYMSFISGYIADEQQRAKPDDGGDSQREKPLCRCDSPTCWLKRGEVPPDIRDKSDGLLTSSSPQDRTVRFINSHVDPLVLREAHQEAQEQKRDGRARLIEARAEAQAEATATVSKFG